MEQERFEVEAIGEIETEDHVLVIKRIVVRYRLVLAAEHHEDARRVHEFHARFCPVARSLEGGIDVRTELELI